jgi:iron complex outermembrane receptor protein
VGTPVGLQDENFQLNDDATDGVCLVQAPGVMVTHQGAFRDEPIGAAGEYVPHVGLVNLEDFQGLEHDINDIDNWATRGILRFQPFDGMEWILNGHGGRNRSDSRHLQSLGAQGDFTQIMFQEALEGDIWSEANAARIMQGRNGIEGTRNVDGLEPSPSGEFPGEGGSDPFAGFYNLDGTEYLDTWGVSLRGDWDLGGAHVTSLTGYEWYDRFVEDEGDANPINSFPADYEDSAWQASWELRAEGEGERYIWRTGFFSLYEDLDAFNLFPDTRKFRIEQTFDQTLWSLAPFAAGRLFLTEEVSLNAGLRYNVEHKEFTLGTAAVGTVSGISFDQIPEQSDEKTWTGLTGDATLSWQPTGDWLYAARLDSLTVYGKYARGMKGGHFNAGLTIRGEFAGPGSGETLIPRVEAVEPEFIDSVEMGFKSRWLEDRLILNFAIFRYWYEDLQVFDIINEKGELPLQQLLNGDAEVWGAELELQGRPLPGLFIQLGGGWLDTEFTDFSVTKSVGKPRGLGESADLDYSGNPLIAAPEWSLSGVVEYQIPLSRWGSLVPQYDFSYRSKIYLDPQHADPISQDPYTLQNARLAYRTPDGRIEVAAWVRNITDERYKIDVFDFSRDFSTILEVWGDPRTYGVTTSYAW